MLGAITLFRRWRQRSDGSGVLTVAGWVLLAVALALWITAYGVEFGSVLGLTVSSLAAFAVIALHADFRRRGDEPERRDVAPLTLDRVGYHHSGLHSRRAFRRCGEPVYRFRHWTRTAVASREPVGAGDLSHAGHLGWRLGLAHLRQ
ncbi:MAG: DUF3325 family protein [Gammaproteobacteria bacterium]|nr:DUF3325 family protein [Gammaproteobacteria bacterium]